MTAAAPNSYQTGPDERGHFGIYGGRFVAETLMPLILDLEEAYETAKNDPDFHASWTTCKPTSRAPEPALFRRAADRAFRRRQDLFQAR